MKYLIPTEVGLLGIWDPSKFTNITSQQTYVHEFVDKITDVANKGLAAIWGTGGDGKFSVEVRVDPESDLSLDEQNIVDLEALNLKLVATSDKLILGSPEFVGSAESEGLKLQMIHELDLEIGIYSVNVYFLYDGNAYDYLDSMSSTDADRYLQENPDYLKPDFVVALHRVDDNHEFSLLREIPVLG